jgi:hypothetical protein
MAAKLISGGNFDFDLSKPDLSDTESTLEFKDALRKHYDFKEKHPIAYFFKKNVVHIAAAMLFLLIASMFFYFKK